MPMLQIDGVPIAEISESRAALLMNMAKHGGGLVVEPASFQTGVGVGPNRPTAPTATTTITLAFPQPV